MKLELRLAQRLADPCQASAPGSQSGRRCHFPPDACARRSPRVGQLVARLKAQARLAASCASIALISARGTGGVVVVVVGGGGLGGGGMWTICNEGLLLVS